MIPKEQRGTLTNNVESPTRINKLTDDQSHSSLSVPSLTETISTNDTSKVNKVSNPYRQSKKKKQSWADKIEWKVLKGETCPACFGTNHNIYSTGCPEMARFCLCQKFYETADKEKLAEVTERFKEYQLKRAKLREERVHQNKRVLRLLNDQYDSKDMAQLKRTYFDAYKQEFDEEQYCKVNPYENLEK